MSSNTSSIIPKRGTKAYDAFRKSQRYTDLMVGHFCAASASHSHIDELEDILRGIYDGSIVTPALIRQHRGPERKLSANGPIWFSDKPDAAQARQLVDEFIAISAQGKIADLANMELEGLVYIDHDVADGIRRDQAIKQPAKPPINLALVGSKGVLRLEDVALTADMRHGIFRNGGINDCTVTNSNWCHSQHEKLYSRDSHFELVDFRKASLYDAIITHNTFTHCAFLETHLHGITFQNCVFRNCDFHNATLSNCTFRDCQFINCDMKDAKLVHGTKFTGATSHLAGMKNADYMEIHGDVVIDSSVPHSADASDPVSIIRNEADIVRRRTYDGKVGYPEPHRDPDQAATSRAPPAAGGVQAVTHQGKDVQDPELARLIAEGEASGKVARFPGRGGGSGKQ